MPHHRTATRKSNLRATLTRLARPRPSAHPVCQASPAARSEATLSPDRNPVSREVIHRIASLASRSRRGFLETPTHRRDPITLRPHSLPLLPQANLGSSDRTVPTWHVGT